ncbi:MAG: ribonuclease P protein component [Deltaproteobacteria bacterium]|nr:ribonuclease P protein component [Deltaproteobacteria bacterium]
MSNENFPKSERLRKRHEFKKAESAKIARLSTKHLVILIAPNSKNHSRIGFTVSKKIGKAVKRNKIRRLLREIYRKHKELFQPGYDYVIIAKAQKQIWSQEELYREITGALSTHTC